MRSKARHRNPRTDDQRAESVTPEWRTTPKKRTEGGFRLDEADADVKWTHKFTISHENTIVKVRHCTCVRKPRRFSRSWGRRITVLSHPQRHFHGRTRMIVFPLIRLVGLKAATASSRVETLPMFVRSRPSRTRRTISLSWARWTRQRSRPPGRWRAASRSARRWTPVFLRLESGLRTASRCRRR